MASTSNTSSGQELEEIVPSTFNSGGSTMSVKEQGCDVFISHAKSPLARDIGEMLNAMGLKCFLNSKELELGDEEVEAAINSSSIYIPILSEDHAQSSRCLEDLLFMHRRREDAKLVPIFYHVKPEDARYIKGAYAAAFDRYKNNDEHPSEKLEEWKEALSSVSNYMGHVVKSKEDEERLLERIPVEFASANTSTSSSIHQQIKSRKLTASDLAYDVFSTSSSIHQQIKSRKLTASDLDYDVFINYRGRDVKDTIAIRIYKRLKGMGLKSFLDSEELRLGDHIPSVQEQAINSAKVQITLFSKRYAESAFCLDELELMLKTKATIIPVFDGVSPEDLRSSTGAYANAFDRWEGRYTSEKIARWKKALRDVSYIFGPIVKNEEDEDTLLRNIVSRVQFAPSTIPERDLAYDVFINHRGPDVKLTLAKAVHKRLKDMGLKPFLDSEELRWGDHVPSVLEKVMKNAKLHIAIFSKNYAQSQCCLRELAFMHYKTSARIIPIFYHCKVGDVRYAIGDLLPAFDHYEETKRYSPEQLWEWKEALYNVSRSIGFSIDSKEDEDMLLKNISYLCEVFVKRMVTVVHCNSSSTLPLLNTRGMLSVR